MALVALSYVKTALGITGTDDDTYLTNQINALSAYVEDYIGRDLEYREHTETFTFPPAGYQHDTMILRNGPVDTGQPFTLTVDSEVIASDGFHIDPQTLILRSASLRGSKDVSVVYTGGYPTIPYDVQEAMTDLVRSRYYGRGTDQTKIIRSENVPDVGSVDYTVSLYYQRNFDPVLGVQGLVFDKYRTVESFGLPRTGF